MATTTVPTGVIALAELRVDGPAVEHRPTAPRSVVMALLSALKHVMMAITAPLTAVTALVELNLGGHALVHHRSVMVSVAMGC